MLIGCDRCSIDTHDLTAQQDGLIATEVKLSIGGSLHDPNGQIGLLLFYVLAMITEFESDLIRMRTREGMKVAKVKGRLRGKPSRPAHHRRVGRFRTRNWENLLIRGAMSAKSSGTCGARG